MKKVLLILATAIVFVYLPSFSQNNLCVQSDPFCTGTTYNFAAGVNAGTAEAGANYGCLGSQPNPAWYYMQVGISGSIEIMMQSIPQHDIDFCCWGPFSNQTTPCVAQLTAGTAPTHSSPGPSPDYPTLNMVDCSYSINPIEYCYIPNAVTGTYYILLITNFSNQPCNIIFSQTGGTGTTNCGILAPPINGDTVCVGETIHLSVNNPVSGASYSWTGPNGFTSTIMNPSIPNATAAMSGTYSLTITLGTQVSPAVTTTVIVNPNPVIFVTPAAAAICVGTTVDLTGSGASNYVWTPAASLSSPIGTTVTASPTATTTYSVIGTDINGCTGSASVTVTATYGPVITITANPDHICAGDSSILKVNGNAQSYSWSPAATLTNPSGQSTTAFPLVTTSYSVMAANGGCNSTAEVTVVVNPVPAIDFSADKTEGCEPLIVNFYDNTTPAIDNWEWDFGVAAASNNVSYLQNPQHVFLFAGTFDISLTVTSTNGCKTRLTKPEMIHVYPIPVAEFTSVPTVISVLDSTVWFSDQSFGAVAWQWDFGDYYLDGNTSDIPNPIHTYSDTGTYVVTEVVTSEFGCTDTATKNIIVSPNSAFFVPNAFTPNRDGLNDRFFVSGDGIMESDFKLRIFDRWGRLVFFTPDLHASWDGSIAGEKAMEGVYTWVIYYMDVKYNMHKIKGFVTLIY
jgi:gliding motility-associated-like protein